MKSQILHLAKKYIESWNLAIDGEYLITNSSLLLPVQYHQNKAILKIPFNEEEKKGCALMAWWDGNSTVGVYLYDDDAILLHKIENNYTSLETLVANGKDTEATEIICKVAHDLLRIPNLKTPNLTPLTKWFKCLTENNNLHTELLVVCSKHATKLLQNQTNNVILHGDLHHQNILFSREKGWLAIDPKALYGDIAFDYVNILCNPTKEVVVQDGRLAQQINLISQYTGISRYHLLEWTLAWAGLSAIWKIEDNLDPELPLLVAEIAYKELNRSNNPPLGLN